MEVKETIRSLIAEIAEISPDEIRDDMSFKEGLEIDSMLVLEMLAELERVFSIRIPEGEVVEFTSLNSVAEVVQRHMTVSADT